MALCESLRLGGHLYLNPVMFELVARVAARLRVRINAVNLIERELLHETLAVERRCLGKQDDLVRVLCHGTAGLRSHEVRGHGALLTEAVRAHENLVGTELGGARPDERSDEHAPARHSGSRRRAG